MWTPGKFCCCFIVVDFLPFFLLFFSSFSWNFFSLIFAANERIVPGTPTNERGADWGVHETCNKS